MQTLTELQAKYPKTHFNHGPYEECPRCHGEGEYMSGLKKLTFCFCLFVDHDYPEFLQAAHEAFNDLAK